MRLTYFETRVLEFFRHSGRRFLPWRKPGVTPYEVWVSEVMLQQTQVNRVIPYYQKFLKRFPTVNHLARTPWKQFLPYYQGLGYYSRGRNMLKAAIIIMQEYGGVFPADSVRLRALPGIGNYTAAAIRSFAFGLNEIAYDTNIRRLLGRFFYGHKLAHLDRPVWPKQFHSRKRQFNAAMMDFASRLCTARPKCEMCPLASRCAYVRTQGQQEIRPTTRRSVFPVRSAQVFLWLHENHRHYYSAEPDQFAMFVLPLRYNTRDTIKAYFKKQYRLNLAVRPPHRRTYIHGVPTVFINAQILSGRPEFSIFSKTDMRSAVLAMGHNPAGERGDGLAEK